MKKVKASEIKLNDSNPRTIKSDNFKKLVKSVKDFPEMLEVRPIVVNTENVVLGGNMRFRACLEAGIDEVPIKVVDWPIEKQKEFIAKDNLNMGEWDWDILANEWDSELLAEWGLVIPQEVPDDYYTKNIKLPEYEPSEEKPLLTDLIDTSKYDELLAEIDRADLPDDEKNFLKLSASRHIVFNYSKIADYYANSEPEVQKLMENSALVIIDIDSAISNGFVELTKSIMDIQNQDYEG